MEKNEVRLTRIEIESVYQYPITEEIVIDYVSLTKHHLSVGMYIKTGVFKEDTVDEKKGDIIARIMTDWYIDTLHPDIPDGNLDMVEVVKNLTTNSKLVAMIQSMVGIMYNNSVEFK